MEYLYTFKRKENKYLIDPYRQELFLQRIRDRVTDDPYGEKTVCNIYLDTPGFRMIQSSIEATEEEKPFKEKIRLRSYRLPGPGSDVFLELKKKYKGIVYKRRLCAPLGIIQRYLAGGDLPEDSQTAKEIDFAMKRYGWPEARMMVFYERAGFFGAEDPSLRITIDRNTRYRADDLHFDYGSGGRLLLPDDTRILEIKASNAYPLWLVRTLDELGIRKTTFSKVATAYKKENNNAEYIQLYNRKQLFAGELPDMPGKRPDLRTGDLYCGII